MKPLLRFAITIMAAGMGASAFAAVPTPVVRWTMDALDADGRIPDATGGGNALELGPGATLKDARFFGAKVLDLDGTQDCWARSTKKLAVGSRTVSVWVSRDETLGPMDPAVNTVPYLFTGLSGSSVNMPGDGIGLRMIADNQILVDGAAPRDRSWMHLVWVLEIVSIEGEKALVSHRVYRDGGEYRNVSGLELTAASINQVSQNLVLGNLEVNGTRPTYGAVRDFCVFDSALDASQVQELYLESLHSRPPRTVGFWRMEDTVEDASGEGPYLEVGSDIAFSENGISGKALDFVDSREAYCVVPNDIPPFTDLSVSMWIRPAKGMESLAAVGNTLPHVFTLQNSSKEYYRVCINEREDVGFRRFSVADMATVDDSSAAAYLTGNVYVEKDLWSHFAFVAKSEYDSSANEWYVEPKYYLNGELVTTGRRTTCNAFKAKGFYPEDLKLVLGNRGYPNNRAFWGQMDDVALIAGALTAEEVRQLYHGVPQVEAGQDLVTVQPTVQLHGELSVVHTGDEGRAVAAAQTTWQLQSAPEGGEGARIENPADLKSRVTLPVEGDYLFRLVAVSGPVKVFDEVTVSRVAPAANVPPAITVVGSGNAYVGIPYPLTATVTDGDEGPGKAVVTWKRESGPEAVLFEPAAGTATRAVFYAPGQYVLKATANDGAASTVATLALTVAAATGDLTDGLMSHIQFDSVDFKATAGEYNTPWSYYYDRKQIHLAPGVAGYGLQVVKPFESSFIMLNQSNGGWTLQEQDANGATESSNKPTNPYRAFSCWLKYDANSDTNNAFHAVIFEQPYNLGLMYDRENGQDVFRMYQNNGGASGDGFDVYSLTEVDMATEWVHVYALFDRCNSYASNVSELWINGVKSTATQKYMGYGRPRNDYLELGGLKCGKGSAGFSNHWTDAEGNSLSRTFPGYIDEFRMYSRNLNEAEIKLLAMHPAPAINRPPAVDGEPGAVELQANVATALSALAADDGLPQGSTLAWEWVVLAGDASQLTFSDRTAKATTVTALKAGTYVLALKATDGARTTYSESIVFEAAKAGMLLLIK